MFAEKFQTFMTWWYSVFADWNPDRLPSYLFWFLQDSQMENIPHLVADALLIVIVCSILSPLLMLIPMARGKGSPIALKIYTIPIAFIGLIGLHLGNSLLQTLITGTLPSVQQLFCSELPAAWQELLAQFAAARECSEGFFFYMMDKPDLLESVFAFFVNAVVGPIVSLISLLLHGGGGLLCLSPFIGLLIANFALYKWTAPVHFIADVGGGVLLIIAAAIALFCYSLYFVFVMLLLLFTGGIMARSACRIVTIRLEYDPFS